MRHAVRLLLVLTLPGLEGCGGASQDSANPCTTIAAEYAAAIPQARICTLAADSCAAQRPMVVYEQHDDGRLTLEGLCHSGGGFLNPARIAGIDAILARYQAAGCSIEFCPGPLPHDPICTEDAPGAFTCK